MRKPRTTWDMVIRGKEKAKHSLTQYEESNVGIPLTGIVYTILIQVCNSAFLPLFWAEHAKRRLCIKPGLFPAGMRIQGLHKGDRQWRTG